ncbi:hypothetical protein BCR36DRAFT_442101 [Piromyces finnis]|uniref:Uncharacterized protein n=1 Tax=Piromyces finnis TaxID=1754191 RepID=A0A1Y1VDP8_9FUNG|nr:hypothetical protein BCR36DRAFT_442101 [Piromyces finnis]|eukprot:ORX53754.1 hypothetical protein BCR36DRAFT_442101 [Piromyces finnis]
MRVQGMGAAAIRDLVRTDAEGTTVYPSLEEMKDALLRKYKLKKDKEDIINELKSLKISYQDNVKEFNKKYMKLFNELGKNQQTRVKANDYLDSIINRTDIWRSVKSEFKQRRISLSEAMDAVEFYDKMNEELNNFNSNKFNSNKFNCNNNSGFNNQNSNNQGFNNQNLNNSYSNNLNFNGQNYNNLGSTNSNLIKILIILILVTVTPTLFLIILIILVITITPIESKCSPLNQNAYQDMENFYVDAIKRKGTSLEPGTEIRKAKSNTRNKTSLQGMPTNSSEDSESDMKEDTLNRKIVNPHSRSHFPSKNSYVNQNSPNKLTNNLIIILTLKIYFLII